MVAQMRQAERPLGRPDRGRRVGLVGGEATQGLQAASEVIGCDEVGEVLPKLVMAVVGEALDGCVLMVRFIRST